MERPEADAQSIDLARLFRALAARKRWIIIPSAAAFLLSLAYVETAAPRYTGVAKVLIENQEGYFTQPDKAAADQAPPLDAEAVASVVEGVATAQVASKVADRLKLASNPEFNPELGVFSSLMARLFGPKEQDASNPALIDNVLSHMTVFAQTKSRVIQIEFFSRSPELAASGANAIADVFLENQQAAKQEEAKAASNWLAKKIDGLREKVAEASAKTEAFRAQSGLLKSGTGADNTTTVSDQQLTDINAQLAAARAAAAQADAKASTLRSLISRGRIDEVPDAAKDDSLRRFLEQRTTLRAQYASESKTLLPQHPKMRELAAQLASLDVEIKDAALRAVKGFENDSSLAQEEVKNLTAEVDAQSKTVASGNEDDIQLKSLELDEKAATDQLESYIQKYREASARDVDADASPPNARVIATATPPRLPTFPQKMPIVVLSTLAAFLLSCGAAATQALLGEAPALAPEGEAALATEAAPAAPAVAPSPPVAAVFDPASRLGPDISALALMTGSRNELADSLEAIVAERGPMLIAVCGVESVTALASALDLGRRISEGQQTVLVDCGETQDWLQDVIGLPCEQGPEGAGLADLLQGRATYAEVLRPDLSGELDILPRGAGPVNATALPSAFTALTRAYRCIVVSVSDWRAEEARLALAAASLALLVGPQSAVEAAAASLTAAGAKAQGLVILAQPEAQAKRDAVAAA